MITTTKTMMMTDAFLLLLLVVLGCFCVCVCVFAFVFCCCEWEHQIRVVSVQFTTNGHYTPSMPPGEMRHIQSTTGLCVRACVRACVVVRCLRARVCACLRARTRVYVSDVGFLWFVIVIFYLMCLNADLLNYVRYSTILHSLTLSRYLVQLCLIPLFHTTVRYSSIS